MQVQKDNIRKRILEVSKEEFLEKGFKDVSMRSIAMKAEVGLSNIYNYFKNKNEILGEVLYPLLNAFDKLLEEHNEPKYISKDIFTSEQYQLEHTERFVQLILKFKKELKLLLFHSHGSTYENFWDEFSDKQTETGWKYIQKMKEKYPQVNTNMSEFFLHTMSSWWLTIIGEIVSHNLTKAEMEQFFSDYIAFGTAGWKKLMNI